jgi:hypothetical protein
LPIIVNPSFVPPAPPATATSSDGRLTATLHPDWAGVLLKADFSSLGTPPVKVRFLRDGDRVRSGDPAWAPGGIAVAYDPEPTLGVASSWTAVPIFADGSLGTASAVATLDVPEPADLSTGWIKPLGALQLAFLARLAGADEGGRTMRTELDDALGSPFPVGSWDVPSGLTITVAVRTDTAEEYDALVAALSAGPVLYQGADAAGIPRNLYALPTGTIAADRMAGAEVGFGWAYRRWNVTLTEVQRPATIDSPLVIPGLSWDTVAADYASWTAVAADKASWTALLGA